MASTLKQEDPTSRSSNDRIQELTADLQGLASELTTIMKTQDRPTTSFDQAYRAPETSEYTAVLTQANDAIEELSLLINGPKLSLTRRLLAHYDLAAYQVALEFDLFSAVPLDGGNEADHKGMATLEQISQASGIDQDRLARILRFLATQRVFEEVRPSVFRHTAQSAYLASDEGARSAALMQLDEMVKAASETAESIRRSPETSDAQASPFAIRFGQPVWQYYAQNPLKGVRFAKSMAAISNINRQVDELRSAFDWSSLGHAKVIDIGGGNGHISAALSKDFPELTFEVQDLSLESLAQGRESFSAAVSDGRLIFKERSFFEPQSDEGAGAFIIRQCLHNQTDTDVVKILRAILPGLEGSPRGTPLLINETIIPKPGEASHIEEHDLRQMDMLMMVVLGAKQRTLAEFESLIHQADPRLQASPTRAIQGQPC